MTRLRTSYLICTNPRSGSWLLAEAMRATGAVGRPEEYFNSSLRPLYMKDLHLPEDASAELLLTRILEAGTTDSGIFGAKVHRLQYSTLIDLLRAATGDWDADEVSLLSSTFPGLVLIHHDRLDRVGQALSWHRALASDNWWHVPGVRDVRSENDVTLDVDRVSALVRRLESDDAAWRELFRRSSLPVFHSTYEELIHDHGGTVRRLVEAVGGPADARVTAPALARQSDRKTDRWRSEYLRRASPGPAPSRPGSTDTSVVVVSHNEGTNLLRTVTALGATTPPGTQIVVVDDCSTDGSIEAMVAENPAVTVVTAHKRLGVAGSRNAGAEVASGEVVVFSDAHVDPSPGWLPPILEALRDPAVGEVAPTVCDMNDRRLRGFGFTWPDLSMRVEWLRAAPPDPVDVPFICGCFLAMRKETFEAVGRFDSGLLRWGSEDAELSLRVWRRGLRCVVVPEAVVAHLFRPTFAYAVAWEHTLHNMLRVAAIHFPRDVLAATFERFRDHPAFAAAVGRLDLADVQGRRHEYDDHDPHDARWFLERFCIAETA